MQGYQLEKKPNICRDLDGGAVGIFLADMTQQIQFYTLDLGGTVDLPKTVCMCVCVSPQWLSFPSSMPGINDFTLSTILLLTHINTLYLCFSLSHSWTHTCAHRYLLFCIDTRTRKHTRNLILNSFNEDNVFPPVCCVL